MNYRTDYNSPIGKILLTADEKGLTGLWFYGEKYFPHNIYKTYIQNVTSILAETKKWLDIYFNGYEPNFTPPLNPVGTDFRHEVWKILLQIPYGKTVTYGDIAEILAKRKGISKMSAQAVGSAVGHNGISIIIPCHRVVGKSGSLTGYAGGIDKKIQLLKIEKADISNFFIPKEKKNIYEVSIISTQLLTKLLNVWESSVRATHLFLSDMEVNQIKKYVPNALNSIEHLIVYENEYHKLCAFMGIENNRLEMLFISPLERKKGIGKQLLQYGIQNYGIKEVTVNEQNPQAIGFYEHMGFKTYKRTEYDEENNPYPLLYMKLM